MEEGHTGLEAEMFARQFSSLLGTVDLTVWHHLSTICLLDVTACDATHCWGLWIWQSGTTCQLSVYLMSLHVMQLIAGDYGFDSLALPVNYLSTWRHCMWWLSHSFSFIFAYWKWSNTEAWQLTRLSSNNLHCRSILLNVYTCFPDNHSLWVGIWKHV